MRKKKKEGRRPGSPVSLLLRFNRLSDELQSSPLVPGLRYRSAALLVGFALALFSLLGGSGEGEVIDLTPQVAKIAPSLSLPVEMNQQVERGWRGTFRISGRHSSSIWLVRGCIPG